MTYGQDGHRRMDTAAADAMSRDGGEQHQAPAMRSRDRARDARSLSGGPGAKVLLATLSIRTSGKGRPYLSGWLGKASVVAFQGEPDRFGNETWDIYVTTPQPRET